MTAPPARHRHSLIARLSNKPPPKSLPKDIVENLNGVLNSRKGFGSFQPELGLGDFLARRGSRGATEVLQAEMESNLAVLEPRLSKIKVRMLGQDHDFWLHFSAEGVADGEQVRLVISFQTTVGGVRVRVA